MRKWVISLLAATIVTAIAYFVSKQFFAATGNTAHYTLTVNYENNKQQSPEKFLSSTVSILSMRLKDAGFASDYSLKQEDQSYQLRFDIPVKEATDTQMLNVLLRSKGHLQFWETYSYVELPSFNKAFEEAIDSINGSKTGKKKQDDNDSSLLNLMQLPGGEATAKIREQLVKFSYEIPEINIKDTAEVGRILRHPIVIKNLPADVFFCYGPGLSREQNLLQLYALRSRGRETSFLDNRHVKTAIPEREPSGNPVINLEFTNEGANIWARVTEKNTGKAIAICMDNWVVTAPRISEKILGGRSVIAGAFSMEEVKTLVALMNTTPVPASILIKSNHLETKPASLSGRRLLILGLVFGVAFALCLICLNFLSPKAEKPAPEVQNPA